MSAHTPGPWMVSGPSRPTVDSIHGGDYAIMDGGTNIIAEAFYQTDVDIFRPASANAHLIAAAPDLLEALEAIEGCYQCGNDLNIVMDQVRVAIAKAKGEPHA